MNHTLRLSLALTTAVLTMALGCRDVPTSAVDPPSFAFGTGPIASVSLTPDALSLEVGATGTLACQPMNAAGEPLARNCNYRSRDASVATVTGNGTRTGTVTSIKAGSVWIVGSAEQQRESTWVNVGTESPPPGPDTPVATSLSFVAQPSNTEAGGTMAQVTVEIKDQSGVRLTSGTNSITLAIGTNPAGGTLTGGGPVTAVNGLATFSGLSINNAGSGYTLSATSGPLTGATSTAFNITEPSPPPPPGPGLITHALLTAGNNTTNQAVYTTASVSPAPNTLVTVAVLGRSSLGTPSVTVSGGGMAAWTQVASAPYDPLGTPAQRLTVFRAMSATPGSGPLTLTFTTAQSNARWIVSQWGGVATTGVNGAGAIGQSGSAGSDAATGLAVPLGVFGNGSNVALGVFAVNKGTLSITPGTGFTEISEQASETASLQAEWAVNDNTIDAGWASSRGGGLGIEIRAGAAATPAAATSVAFVTQPSNTQAGGTIAPVTVEIKDQFNARFSSNANVTLAIGTNAGTPSGTLGGTKTVAAVNGLATFNNLSIDNPGNGYTLTASSGTLGGTTSNAFDITALPPPPTGESAVLLAAGDIASCSSSANDEATATLLDRLEGTIVTLGDNVYGDGTATQFTNCYEPTWGRHKLRTRPAPGNHDYHTSGAAAYYAYFGENAGPAGRGYYSYDLGEWHIVSLNSNVSMAAGSDQEKWLRADLAANPRKCTLAYWHHPRFSSGAKHGNFNAAQPIWQALYEAGADVVLSGHEHNYERFAPQSPTGAPDPARGIQEFVVGTGGVSHYSLVNPLPNSEMFNGTTWGVLKLTLDPSSYRWEFIPIAGLSFTDSGTGQCH